MTTKNILEETFSKCLTYIKSNETAKATSEAQSLIEKCKNIIYDSEMSSEVKDDALLIGIFFRGIQNFANLKQMTISSDWIKKPALVNQIWCEMWDCKDRLKYAASSFINSYINKADLEWIYNEISSLYQYFNQEFGHGLYASPTFLFERMICSICGQDARACEHITGKIYSGNICENNPSKVVPGDHMLITENPADPRCRVWAWQNPDDPRYELWTSLNEKESYEEICALYFFLLNDFMYVLPIPKMVFKIDRVNKCVCGTRMI